MSAGRAGVCFAMCMLYAERLELCNPVPIDGLVFTAFHHQQCLRECRCTQHSSQHGDSCPLRPSLLQAAGAGAVCVLLHPPQLAQAADRCDCDWQLPAGQTLLT